MLNKIILIGRLTQDPELRYTPNGNAVANFSLAVERSYTNRQGERDVDFIDIVVWRKQAETCANHLGKGRLVAVEGRLQIRSYETDEGQRTLYFTLHFLVPEGLTEEDKGLELVNTIQQEMNEDEF